MHTCVRSPLSRQLCRHLGGLAEGLGLPMPPGFWVCRCLQGSCLVPSGAVRRPQGSPSLPWPQGPSRSLLLNGKPHPTKVRLIRGCSLPPVKRRRMNWIDAPDDVFYMATEETR